jgi:kynureninase
MGDSSNLSGRDYAVELDSNDVLRHTRDEFNIPSKADVARKTLPSGNSTGKCHCPLLKNSVLSC